MSHHESDQEHHDGVEGEHGDHGSHSTIHERHEGTFEAGHETTLEGPGTIHIAPKEVHSEPRFVDSIDEDGTHSEHDLYPDGHDHDEHSKLTGGDANRDPVTGAPGAHPVGLGVGGVAGSVAAGAAVGAVAGPPGALAGAVVGAVIGAAAGKATAESVNPTDPGAAEAAREENRH